MSSRDFVAIFNAWDRNGMGAIIQNEKLIIFLLTISFLLGVLDA